jgi:formylglycine-generating enzyme required for sulfatase activity
MPGKRFSLECFFASNLLFLMLIAVASLLGCSGQVVTRKNPIDGKVMVRIPAGDFRMGTSAEQGADLAKQLALQKDLFGSEEPQQSLSLAEFYIDQTPVTNAEYKKFLDANPDQEVPYLAAAIAQSFNWDKTARTFPATRDQYPVVLVTWQQATAYCKWAGGRLPTEAEWEKAARGTDGRIYPWGNEWDASKANTAESRRQDATPVGQFSTGASPYGALDMVGNVWQWTSSLDKSYPYNANDGREDRNAAGLRITRGGSWLFGAAVSRVATRNRFESTDVSLSIGFRCAQ